MTQNVAVRPAARALYVIGHDTFPGEGEAEMRSSSNDESASRSSNERAVEMPCSVSLASSQCASLIRSTSAASRSVSQAIRPASPDVSLAGVEALRRFNASIPSIASRLRPSSRTSGSCLETLEPPQLLRQFGGRGRDEGGPLFVTKERRGGGGDLVNESAGFRVVQT